VHTTTRKRTLAVPTQELWELVRDPYHLPRWWPRVARVEAVTGDAFTEVLRTDKGKLLRADFTLLHDADATDAAAAAQWRLAWRQQLEGTPFARLLTAAETEVRLTPAGAATEVVLELRQQLAGVLPRFGAVLVHRAAAKTLEAALDGLEQISTGEASAR
jgi:carbon monoxide dehydrogenase subunit G